jgi:hypothetical protein
MREVVAVAQAHGMALPHDSVEKASAFLDRISPAAIGNMGAFLA